MTFALSISMTLATVVATLMVMAPAPVHAWVRRIFLILLNLNPWTVGTWRRSFTRRETFLAAWFMVFVASLVVCAFIPLHWRP